MVAVSPASLLISPVEAVTPSMRFSSAAVAVIAVPAIWRLSAGMFTAPVKVAPPNAAFAFNCVCIEEVTPSM